MSTPARRRLMRDFKRWEKKTSKERSRNERKAGKREASREVHTIVGFCGFVFRGAKKCWRKETWGCAAQYIHIGKHTAAHTCVCAPRLYVVEKFAQPKYERVCVSEWLIIFAAFALAKNNNKNNSLVFDTWLWCVRGAGGKTQRRGTRGKLGKPNKILPSSAEIASQQNINSIVVFGFAWLSSCILPLALSLSRSHLTLLTHAKETAHSNWNFIRFRFWTFIIFEYSKIWMLARHWTASCTWGIRNQMSRLFAGAGLSTPRQSTTRRPATTRRLSRIPQLSKTCDLFQPQQHIGSVDFENISSQEYKVSIA